MCLRRRGGLELTVVKKNWLIEVRRIDQPVECKEPS